MDRKLEILKILYSNILTNLKINKKFNDNSILLSFLQLKSNSRFGYLEQSAEDLSRVDNSIIQELINIGYIREAGEVGYYSITAQGIWKIENEEGITSYDIIDFIDKKFFNISLVDRGLTDKEKIILLSLISARAFSQNYAFDLKKGDTTLDSIKRIIDQSYELLYELNLINEMNEKALYGKRGNEHIVSHLIRHTDQLPKKTKSLFIAPGDQKYYLSLSKNGNLSEKKLVFLLKEIFEKRDFLDIEECEKIMDYCNKIVYDEGIHIYDNISESFATPMYDDCIYNSIISSVFD